MGKKLADISIEIDSKAYLFRRRLERMVDAEVIVFLEDLSKRCNVYIFSGVIRDYFLNAISNRDIDLVLDGPIILDQFLEKYSWSRNSFGGFKIKINEVSIDMWQVKDTWAFSYQKTIDYELARFIPSTAFFNFSSIVYHYNENKFHHTPDFAKFIKKKEIDITYYPNANVPLCVVNSFYYSDKLGFPLGIKLIDYIKKKFDVSVDYSKVQIKHFGKILYSREDLINRVSTLSNYIMRS